MRLRCIKRRVKKMDTPLEKAIKWTEERLEKLKKKDIEAVFHCPECGQYLENIGNYRTLGMCGKCYTKVKTKEMEDHVRHIIGGTITNIQVAKADPLNIVDEPQIVQITVKTKDGKSVKLKKPEETIFIF